MHKQVLLLRILNGLKLGSNFVVHVSRPLDVEESRKNLSIIMMEQEIMEVVSHHSVVIICGETGCGKTTQVPQVMCLIIIQFCLFVEAIKLGSSVYPVGLAFAPIDVGYKLTSGCFGSFYLKLALVQGRSGEEQETVQGKRSEGREQFP